MSSTARLLVKLAFLCLKNSLSCKQWPIESKFGFFIFLCMYCGEYFVYDNMTFSYKISLLFSFFANHWFPSYQPHPLTCPIGLEDP